MAVGRALADKNRVSTLREQTETASREEFLPTGIARLDQILGGGVPRGALSEITGSFSSGKTGLLFSILKQATTNGEVVAYIDAFDSLDPVFAQRAGLDLKRLLWVRCQGDNSRQRIDKALKAADILTRADGFGALALDLENLQGSSRFDLSKVPLNAWFRLKRSIQGKPTALLVMGGEPCSGSASTMTLGLERQRVRWRARPGSDLPSHARLLRGIASQARLLRGKKHGHVTVYCDF